MRLAARRTGHRPRGDANRWNRMAAHIRKGDVVEVIAGDHRGARGKVLRLDPRRGEVFVEGVNMVYRHVRPTRRNPQGGRLQREAPIHLSNVLPYDSAAGKGRRVRFAVDRDEAGKIVGKRRMSVAGTTLHTLTRAELTPGPDRSRVE